MDLIAEGSRVLDLGCGEGDLLLALKIKKHVRAEGIELDNHMAEVKAGTPEALRKFR